MKRTIVGLMTALLVLAGVQGAALARKQFPRPVSSKSVAAKPVARVVTPDEAAGPHDPRVPRAPKPKPRPAPPKPAEPVFVHPRYATGDVVEISIRDQRIRAWRGGKVAMEVIISTGRPGYATPTGHYRVIFKSRRVWSYDWKVWMPWAMNWHGNYFIHQLPNYPGSGPIGAGELGRPASHGCVRVNVGDAEALYRWTQTGTPVWVH